MALIVEDGTGLSNADSYISSADATIYHTNIGNAGWNAVVDKDAALRKATEYMRSTYYGKWAGYPKTQTQRLDWPRYSVEYRNGGLYADNAVPEEVKNACAELALKSTIEELMPDAEQTVKREQVGPIEVEYNVYGVPTNKFTAITAMLAPLLNETRSANMVPLVRG
jgi:hypothetical protein